MVRTATIAGASIVLLLSAARFSSGPATHESATTSTHRKDVTLTANGPVTVAPLAPVPVNADALGPRDAQDTDAQDTDAQDTTLGTKLQLLALFGNLTEITIPVVDFSNGIDSETLWLARAIYSETKLVHEQELVAWVIRNRVETGYRGKHSYRDVILDPYQFSAFNPGHPKRAFYSSLTPVDSLPGWQRALRIAHYVRHADAAYRPFSIKTRHFYSEQSMVGRRHPHWANHRQRVTPNWTYRVDQRRFRFYEAIS